MTTRNLRKTSLSLLCFRWLFAVQTKQIQNIRLNTTRPIPGEIAHPFLDVTKGNIRGATGFMSILSY